MRASPLVLAVALLAGAGCGGSSLPPEADPAKGRDALKTVLDAWKRGDSIEQFKQATPAIQVRDPDWAAGHKLTAYEIAPEHGRSGVDLLLAVKLSLVRADGRPQERQVSYVVGINSATIVFRNE